jgi:hypothetical protein
VEIAIDQSVTIQPTLDGDPPTPLSPLVASSRRKFSGSFDRDFDGIGDVIIFSKWQVLSQHGLPMREKAAYDMAWQAEIKLPTGDEEQFLGTGETDVALRVLLQREISNKIRMRGELGYNRSGLGSEFNTYEYKIGGEWVMIHKLAASVEIIGSYSREFSNVIDIAAGAKLEVSRDVKVFAGVRAPLNDSGLRYGFSPIVGIEYVYSRPPAGMDGLEPLDMEELPMEPVGPAQPTAPMQPMPIESRATPPAGTPAGIPPVTTLGGMPGGTATRAAVTSRPAMPSAMPQAGETLKLEPVGSLHLVDSEPRATGMAAGRPLKLGRGVGSAPATMPGKY